MRDPHGQRETVLPRHTWGVCQDADSPALSPQGLCDLVNLRGVWAVFTLNSYLSASNLGPVTVICGSGKFYVTPPWTPLISSSCVDFLCRDGVPYCESDYHSQFGIKCETCDRYISGRVLEVSGYK